jgi:predicted anti-sigma-YlaC factor YlaD
MRCSKIRESLDPEHQNATSASVQEHLSVCAECRSYAANLSRLTEGMKLLAQEDISQPSLGFSERVLRRLEQETGWEFLESVGRRVVYATLVLVLFLLLAMILPSSGPVRRAPTLDTYWPQEQSVAAENYQIPMERLSPARDLVNFKSSGPGGH